MSGATPALVLTAYIAGMSASSIAFLPGGFGVVEVAMIGTLHAGRIDVDAATAAVLMYRLVSCVLVVCIGWLVWYLTVARSGKRDAAPLDTTPDVAAVGLTVGTSSICRMDVRVISTAELGDRSYVIAAGESAVVVDAQRDIDRVLEVVDQLGARGAARRRDAHPQRLRHRRLRPRAAHRRRLRRRGRRRCRLRSGRAARRRRPRGRHAARHASWPRRGTPITTWPSR